MSDCRVKNELELISDLRKVLDDSTELGFSQGCAHVKQGIINMMEEAKASPSAESQVELVKSVINMYYDDDGDYGKYIAEVLPRNKFLLLFDVNYNQDAAAESASSSFEEAAASSKQIRSRNFLERRFKGAPNAKLYFQRSVLIDLVETFLVRRKGRYPRYFSSQKEMNENVRLYHQELLDRVFEYLDNDPFMRDRVANLPRVMYQDGVYTEVISQIKSIVDLRLNPEAFAKGEIKSLESHYQEYRDTHNKKEQLSAERFLNAYNAWIVLQDFDTVLSDMFGTIVQVKPGTENSFDSGLTKYSIRNKASNMWESWGDSDDISDMSEIISDVTQALINTSKMYQWGSSEPFNDRYVSFHDFNYVIGTIKKYAFDSKMDQIFLHEVPDIDKTSIHTRRVILDILAFNRANGIGNVIKNADGSEVFIPKGVTWKQLVSRMNENPQKYLHAIFDILCNTKILEKDGFNLDAYKKNLIWSFHKEIFGGDGNSRSLFRIHAGTRQDNIYQIITQVAASTFPEEYLQYYERNDGSISTRLLQDYAIEGIKNSLYNGIQQTSVAITSDKYSTYGVTVKENEGNSAFVDSVFINIPVNETVTLNIQTTFDKVSVDDYTEEQSKYIWENSQFQRLVKDILGIDFALDPDLKSAYLEIVGDKQRAVKDLSRIIGRVIYTSVLNNDFVPRVEGAENSSKKLKEYLKQQLGTENDSYIQNINSEGYLPVIPGNIKEAYLENLARAMAVNRNLLAAAQSKTGEGTSLANYTLSRMRNFYQNQIEMQCKKRNSAVRDLSFVVNTNGLFRGLLSRRELKTLHSNQQSTQFSDEQSFQLSFINDFVAAFIPNPNNNTYIKDGVASFLPTVNSDKTQIDGLLADLYAKSSIRREDGSIKTYIELTDQDIESEMELEFKPMYDRIIQNVNNELLRFSSILGITGLETLLDGKSVILQNHIILNAINGKFKDDESLGVKVKDRVKNGLHRALTQYNLTHSRNPIMLAPNVHYTFDADGLLTSNKVLEALWGRFNSEVDPETKAYLTNLYSSEAGYFKVLTNNNIEDPTSSKGFFLWHDYHTVKDLLGMGFEINLLGSDNTVRHQQPEIKFLRGETYFTDAQFNNPEMKPTVSLCRKLKNWVGADGRMIIAKGVVDGEEVPITDLATLDKATNLVLHPLLSKLNRLDYLLTQQYVVSTVGSHYVHSGKSSLGKVLLEEAGRWLASNKRNVAATSTVHLFQNKQLNGVPSVYNMAIAEDFKTDLYSIMGDLAEAGHKPLDGCLFSSAFIPELENNSLGGEAAGSIKKPFGTFYSELYAAGGIVKTASFPPTNASMRRSSAWFNLQRNMSRRLWVKEYPDAEGKDIPEIVDITKNFFVKDAGLTVADKTIDYREAIGGKPIMYKRPMPDKPNIMAAYRLERIESLGNNQYIIYEVEIDKNGVEIGEVAPRSEIIDDGNGNLIEVPKKITINNNWSLFTEVFGGCYSLELGSNGELTWSENSIKLVVYAMNNVGYRKDSSYLNTSDFDQFDGPDANNKGRTGRQLRIATQVSKNGLDQDDIWQPLKYSEIHYIPNIGAIKSLQFNVNPEFNPIIEEEVDLNIMIMRLAQLGIQLDKEHHADAADVSMPTQIIQALANKGFTSEYAKAAYRALEVLTKQAIEPYLAGIEEIITSNNPETLVTEVTNLIIDHLINQKEEENSVTAILSDLMEKARNGKTIDYAKDIKGKIPWSDPTISGKLFSIISTTLTNLAVKMKFAGSLSVICPTDPIEQLYGDFMLSSFAKVVNEDGSTRTISEQEQLDIYQNEVIKGTAVDSEGRNLKIYDADRDVAMLPDREAEDSDEIYNAKIEAANNRFKLSKVAELKTQHNYIIEFDDGSTESVSINVPPTYYRIKDLVVNGKIKDGKLLKVTRIYEDVKKGRSLAAYNVRFSDYKGRRYQIFDLDSIALLFKLNELQTEANHSTHAVFTDLTPEQQQDILNDIFNSSAFKGEEIYARMLTVHPEIPRFDNNFIFNILNNDTLSSQFKEIINNLVMFTKPRAYMKMQSDLFKLSANYTGERTRLKAKSKDGSTPNIYEDVYNRVVYVNGHAIEPLDIQSDAYEVILPQIYKTQFGLQEFDDLQEIIRDKDFFLKRGINRFKCKLDNHDYYDYELKCFNGDHKYILDSKSGLPEGFSRENIVQIDIIKEKGRVFRVDANRNILYELSSEKDYVCKVGNTEIIVTDNPEFYLNTLNYNTLKVSPARITQESYDNLINILSISKRKNHSNLLKAISTENGYLSLGDFKRLNIELDNLTYETVIAKAVFSDFKSIQQLCNLLIKDGRELHTSFDESLNVIAGRIPAQSQQSFMTQRVVGFDSSGLNTAMVSTFQLYLQGSDLDIDAVTMLGYEFDKHGKFIGWSPYFDLSSRKHLAASKSLPLPTGEEISVETGSDNDFFRVYDRYFGTLFKPIRLKDNTNKTKNGVIELSLDISTPEGLTLLGEFLADVEKYGIKVSVPVRTIQGKTLLVPPDKNFFNAPDLQLEDGRTIAKSWNLYSPVGMNVSYADTFNIAEQLVDFVNRHNMYIRQAPEFMRIKMAKNNVVYNIYRTAEAPCNQVEGQISVDVPTQILKSEAKKSSMATASDSYAPGRVTSKVKSIGEGQAGKSGVGIGAVGIKANSTTQFYLSEIINYGTAEDRKKILFRTPYTIKGVKYRGFANMHTNKKFTIDDMLSLEEAFDYMDNFTSPDQITDNVAINLAAMLSISVDNAKDLALAKINSGPKMMGMYVYGMTLGVPITTLSEIMRSPEAVLLKELMDGSQFNNDITPFKVIEALEKLKGDINSDLGRFTCMCKNKNDEIISYTSTKTIIKGVPLVVKTPQDALFGAMYKRYLAWVESYNKQNQGAKPIKPAGSFGTMIKHLLKHNAFSSIYNESKKDLDTLINAKFTNNAKAESLANWNAALLQMISYIQDMERKIKIFYRKGSFSSELRILAEGAEEMRILGSILGVNKGLKASMTDMESYVETIEKLIYDRKVVIGMPVSDKDFIDFHKFMTDKDYQNVIIEVYEKIKHSVNIPHLLSKVAHFKGYLNTQLIPSYFYNTSSIKYRTMRKYRRNINADFAPKVSKNNVEYYEVKEKPLSIFSLFDVDSSKDRNSINRGLENLIHYKLLQGWLNKEGIAFKVPAGFTYFNRKGGTATAYEFEQPILLGTDAGLASFKKFMEEVYIPQLMNSPIAQGNTFISNLQAIDYDKTPVHSSVLAYSLRSSNLMTKQGRDGELNAKMFADFQALTRISFQPEMGIPSAADAFYIYAQYCYMGRKGERSLMTLFDSEGSRPSLADKFTQYEAIQDIEGSLTLTREELITWCAPKGNSRSTAKWVYMTSNGSYGVSLKQRRPDYVRLSEDQLEALEQDLDAFDDDENGRKRKIDKYITYKKKYLASSYSRLMRKHFLVPVIEDPVITTVNLPIKLHGKDLQAVITLNDGLIDGLEFTENDNLWELTKELGLKSPKQIASKLLEKVLYVPMPYKAELKKSKERKLEIDLDILQTIFNQLLDC